MFDNRDSTRMRTAIRVLNVLFLGSVIGVLIACSGYEGLGQRPIDRDYTFSKLSWSTGNVSVIALKAFPDEENLAVCAAYTTGIGNFEVQGNRQYFNVATIHMGEERIGPMAFANAIRDTDLAWLTDAETVSSGLNALKANCIRTEIPWEASYAGEKLRMTGPKRIRVFD